jgi:hypothetical protein
MEHIVITVIRQDIADSMSPSIDQGQELQSVSGLCDAAD